MNSRIVELINLIVEYATGYLMPFLVISFLLAIVVRLLITLVINRQRRFVKEFCKRVPRTYSLIQI
jgi:hypothetical protein